MAENFDIDFVIMWVNPYDELWLREKAKYNIQEKNQFANDRNYAARYRDWDNLQYWFRGVEKFTPWVRKIHFVTWRTVPSWLNTEHPKLQIVLNRDILPADCDPVFSPNPLETNLHRIPGIAEHFIYFNDDMFVINHMEPSDFYRGGIPKEMAISYALTNNIENDTFWHMLLTMTGIVNYYFDKRTVQKKNLRKWFHLTYGKYLINNIATIRQHAFSGILIPHLPSPMRKSTYEEVWSEIPDRLMETANHKFRSYSDITQYIFRYWAICKGAFVPANAFRTGKEFFMSDDTVESLCDEIRRQRHKMICINDNARIQRFEQCRNSVIAAFNNILPEKCDFEK